MPAEDDTDARSQPAQPDVPLICAECGDRIDRTEWHPVTTTTDDDGAFRLVAFCSRACREAWQADED